MYYIINQAKLYRCNVINALLAVYKTRIHAYNFFKRKILKFKDNILVTYLIQVYTHVYSYINE